MIKRDFLFNVDLSYIFKALQFKMFSSCYDSTELSQFDLHKHVYIAFFRNLTPMNPIIDQRQQTMI